MFTLKLYDDGGAKVFLVEAENFTVHWDDGKYGAQIIAHTKIPLLYYIGETKSEKNYDFAIIENSNGKTTERLTPTLRIRRAGT